MGYLYKLEEGELLFEREMTLEENQRLYNEADDETKRILDDMKKKRKITV
jgi:hypothetical protein